VEEGVRVVLCALGERRWAQNAVGRGGAGLLSERRGAELSYWGPPLRACRGQVGAGSVEGLTFLCGSHEEEAFETGASSPRNLRRRETDGMLTIAPRGVPQKSGSGWRMEPPGAAGVWVDENLTRSESMPSLTTAEQRDESSCLCARARSRLLQSHEVGNPQLPAA